MSFMLLYFQELVPMKTEESEAMVTEDVKVEINEGPPPPPRISFHDLDPLEKLTVGKTQKLAR